MSAAEFTSEAYRKQAAAELKERRLYWKHRLVDEEVRLGGSGNRSRTRESQARWMACYERTWAKTRACDASQVSASTVRRWESDDPVFSKVLPEVDDAVQDRLVGEANRRAIEGVEEPVYHQGALVGVKRKYSDALLSQLLKAVNPSLFGDASGAKDNGEAAAKRDAAKAVIAGNPAALQLAEQLAALMDDNLKG